MCSKQLSPTANLLRHSRLFSLPPPLPKPQLKATNGIHLSDSATLPYPTHAAIETPTSSLCRGDWGLKRPLPLKSTTTANPVIRVKQIDSIDHITNFESAADHTLTLQKWQEMNLPISVPQHMDNLSCQPAQANISTSVFEERLHATRKLKSNEAQPDATRWKFEGPWLAGFEEGQFQDYVKRRIKHSGRAFREFIREKEKARKAETSRREALDRGEIRKEEEEVELTEDEFNATIVRLRQEGTGLWNYVWEFLDLPGEPPSVGQKPMDDTKGMDRGPPSTHPSAGLSYLRTKSHVHNHPVLGPVNSEPPVEGRVLQRGGFQKASSKQRLIGVAGVVADGGFKFGLFNNPKTKTRASRRGGEKVWVQPKKATIDQSGKIQMLLDKTEESSIAIWENREVGDVDDPEQSDGSGHFQGSADPGSQASNRKVKSSSDVLEKNPLFFNS